MGKYNVGIGLYNSKLSVYTITNSKFFKINNKIDENIDIIENLKSIRKECKKYYNTEEEIEAVLSIQENLPDEVKYKIRNSVKIAGFVLKEEINEKEAISLAYGIEEEDGFIFIISINNENSTLKVISSEYNLDCILDLDINIKDKKNTDNMKVIKYIQDKIKDILKDMNYDREYKVILLGDILKYNLFNEKISNEISNIYNYREDALAMGCAIKSYDNSYDIKVFKQNIEVNGNISKDKSKDSGLNINIAQFYYVNKQYNKAKDILKELLRANLTKDDEYIKSLIYLLHIYIIEEDIEKALPIYLNIRKFNLKDKELEKLYKQIMSKYEPMLIDKYKMRVLRFKYDIMNIIDNGFEFNIDINQKIIDYEVKIKNNSTILNLNKEFIIDELRNEIKTLNENIDIKNITIFLGLRSKIDEIIKYLE